MKLKILLRLSIIGMFGLTGVNATEKPAAQITPKLPAVDGERCKSVAFACPRTGTIVIDGKLSEPDWKKAVAFSNFNNPGEVSGKQPVKFSYRILYDENYVYFGLETTLNGVESVCRQIIANPLPSPKNIGDPRQDRYSSRYSMEIFLAPPHGASPYFQYVYSMDGYRYDGNASPENAGTWNGVWQAASHVAGNTWSMEFKFDVRSMGVARIAEFSEWRYNLVQNRSNAAVAAIGDIANFHVVSAFAELIMGDYAQWRRKVLTDAENSLKVLNNSGEFSASRLDSIKQFMDEQRKSGAAGFKSGTEIEANYQQLNYLKEAIRQLENESAYRKLEAK